MSARNPGSPPSLLVVIGGLMAGGTELHLSRVLPELQRDGFSVTVFSMTGHGVVGPRLAQGGVEVVSIPGWRSYGGLPGPLRRLILLPLVCASLLWCLWRRRPDVVHFFLPEAYLVGAPCSLLLPGVRRVMSRRSLNAYQKKRPLLATLERWLHGRMDLILANSSVVAAQLREEGVADWALRIIDNGFEPPEAGLTRRMARKRLESSLTISPGHFVMVNVANLIPYKGHAVLLSALARIRSQLPQPWVLLCVGRDDGILDQLTRRRRALGLDASVVFCGYRPDVWTLVRGADMGVFASREEGSPNAVLESMRAGLPIVSSAAGGVVELLVGEQSRYVVQVGDAQQLSERVLELAFDEALRRRLGEANERRATQHYSLTRCIAAYGEMYRGLLR